MFVYFICVHAYLHINPCIYDVRGYVNLKFDEPR